MLLPIDHRAGEPNSDMNRIFHIAAGAVQLVTLSPCPDACHVLEVEAIGFTSSFTGLQINGHVTACKAKMDGVITQHCA